MSSRLQDVILRGLAADRPAVGAVGPGTLYFATDTGVTTRMSDDMTAWESYSSTGGSVALHAPTHFAAGTDPVNVTALAGYPGGGTTFLRDDGIFAALPPSGAPQLTASFVAPIPGDYTWVNQGTATLDTSHLGMTIVGPSVGGDNIRALVKATPATPYTVTAALFMNFGNPFPVTGGMCWRDTGTGRMIVVGGFWTNLIGSQKFNTATAFNGDYNTGYSFVRAPLVWLRLVDDGVNRIVSASYDGYNFIGLQSIVRTDFLTANQIGFYAHPTGNPANVTLLSWQET